MGATRNQLGKEVTKISKHIIKLIIEQGFVIEANLFANIINPKRTPPDGLLAFSNCICPIISISSQSLYLVVTGLKTEKAEVGVSCSCVMWCHGLIIKVTHHFRIFMNLRGAI